MHKFPFTYAVFYLIYVYASYKSLLLSSYLDFFFGGAFFAGGAGGGTGMCGGEGGVGVSGGASTRKVVEVFLSLTSFMNNCRCCAKDNPKFPCADHVIAALRVYIKIKKGGKGMERERWDEGRKRQR
jgi:hypothetical protein